MPAAGKCSDVSARAPGDQISPDRDVAGSADSNTDHSRGSSCVSASLRERLDFAELPLPYSRGSVDLRFSGDFRVIVIHQLGLAFADRRFSIFALGFSMLDPCSSIFDS
jgi:hypothetical protein